MGERLVEYCVPVSPCSAPDLFDKTSGRPGSYKILPGIQLSNENLIIPAGHYLDANTCLNAKLIFSKPIVDRQSARPIKSTVDFSVWKLWLKCLFLFFLFWLFFSISKCVFGRMVCIVSYDNRNVIKNAFDLIRTINSESLNFTQYPIHVQDAALSTYKLNE